MRVLLGAALALCLGGCALFGVAATKGSLAALGTGAGAAVATVTAEAKTVDADATDLLAVAKPLNEGLCFIEPWRPHSAEIQAAITAFCANLPSKPQDLITQAKAIYRAIAAEKAKAVQH